MRQLLAVMFVVASVFGAATAANVDPQTVHFLSDDGTTTLVAYLFAPAGAKEPAPAVVMMHGREGPYSSLAKGVYDAETLSQRTKDWAKLWTGQGDWVLVVDSFGPRGFPTGFAAGTDLTRPDAVNEIIVRPLDAYAALRYLRTIKGVDADRIGIQGWSNGGSAVLATLSPEALSIAGLTAATGFKAGLAFYPGCGLQDHFKASGYAPYAPIRMFIGTADEEVSPKACTRLAKESSAAGSDIALTTYDGATHDFDDPGEKRQGVPANVAATKDATAQALAFFATQLGR